MSVGGPHRIAFTDWGPIGSSVPVICVPGLTRQGRDFDFLAAELARCAAAYCVLISLVADGAADFEPPPIHTAAALRGCDGGVSGDRS